MYTLNDKIKFMTPYEPISGDYQTRLDANESFLTLPEDIKAQIQQAVGKIDYNRYPDPYAKKLCKAFADAYGISPELVTAGNGSDELISVIVNSFLQKGERLLVTEPDFSMYRFYGELSEAQIVKVPKKDDLSIDADALIETASREGVRVICFSNPCNPTSLGLTRGTVRKIITSVSALVVLDEAYMDFWEQSMLGETEKYDNLLLLKTCSKAAGFAAARIGFAVAGKPITTAIRAAKSPYNVNSISQEMGTVLLNNTPYLENCRKIMTKSRRELEEKINRFQEETALFDTVYKSCTNFVFIRTGKARQIYEKLLERSIAVRQISGYLRITAGTEQENQAVLNALREISREIE